MRRIAIAAAVLASLTTTAAWAAGGSASATLWNIRYELTDLDPSDGIAPSLVFTTASAFNSTAYAGAGAVLPLVLSDVVRQNSAGDSMFGAASASATWNTASNRSSVSGDGTLGGTVLHAEGGVSAGPRDIDFNAVALVMRDNQFHAGSFALTPHTLVRFSADIDLESSPGGADCCTGQAFLALFAADGSGYADGMSTREGGQGFSSLATSASNLSGASQDFAVSASAGAYGYAAAAPVPEPGTSLLMAAGLAGLGVAARRRAQRG